MTAIGSVAAISAPKASAGAERPGEPLDEPEGDDGRAEGDADERDREDRRQFAAKFSPTQVERRLEQQRRQDQIEYDVVGELQPHVDARKSKAEAGEDEADGIGQPQAPRENRHDHREAEQRDGAPDQEFHGGSTLVARGARQQWKPDFWRGVMAGDRRSMESGRERDGRFRKSGSRSRQFIVDRRSGSFDPERAFRLARNPIVCTKRSPARRRTWGAKIGERASDLRALGAKNCNFRADGCLPGRVSNGRNSDSAYWNSNSATVRFQLGRID